MNQGSASTAHCSSKAINEDPSGSKTEGRYVKAPFWDMSPSHGVMIMTRVVGYICLARIDLNSPLLILLHQKPTLSSHIFSYPNVTTPDGFYTSTPQPCSPSVIVSDGFYDPFEQQRNCRSLHIQSKTPSRAGKIQSTSLQCLQTQVSAQTLSLSSTILIRSLKENQM